VAPRGRAWDVADVEGAAALLCEAYAPGTATYLAPGGTAAAWQRYVRNLVEQTGLGTLNPRATRVLRGDGLGPPAPAGVRPPVDALVVVTALSADTAHLAQVAVHPSSRGKGLAAALVNEACSLAAAEGYSRATLLVSAANAPARRLYEGLGFRASARFIAARRHSALSTDERRRT
jgi:ribosomal protein S18 acetylase RimI-like enzyme